MEESEREKQKRAARTFCGSFDIAIKIWVKFLTVVRAGDRTQGEKVLDFLALFQTALVN